MPHEEAGLDRPILRKSGSGPAQITLRHLMLSRLPICIRQPDEHVPVGASADEGRLNRNSGRAVGTAIEQIFAEVRPGSGALRVNPKRAAISGSNAVCWYIRLGQLHEMVFECGQTSRLQHQRPPQPDFSRHWLIVRVQRVRQGMPAVRPCSIQRDAQA